MQPQQQQYDTQQADVCVSFSEERKSVGIASNHVSVCFPCCDRCYCFSLDAMGILYDICMNEAVVSILSGALGVENSSIRQLLAQSPWKAQTSKLLINSTGGEACPGMLP